jgi:hypothetical protein
MWLLYSATHAIHCKVQDMGCAGRYRACAVHGLCRKVLGMYSTRVACCCGCCTTTTMAPAVSVTTCVCIYNVQCVRTPSCHALSGHCTALPPPPRPPPALLSGIEDPNPFFKWLMGKPFAQNVIWGPHFYAQVNVVTLLPCCSSMVHLESHQKLHCDCVVYHGTLATANLR